MVIYTFQNTTENDIELMFTYYNENVVIGGTITMLRGNERWAVQFTPDHPDEWHIRVTAGYYFETGAIVFQYNPRGDFITEVIMGTSRARTSFLDFDLVERSSDITESL